ncbi:CpsB/CapC family capsule biosynthesis tyrosine phosphatase [Botrimarina sp.]|uniref:tyrosine-protein phosphatase n=1 Tax=Botrimarina sp. TaxID=2795802 RepID=UPI0032EBC4E6
MTELVDIHCHLLPEIDDGAADLTESLAMARLSVEQGVGTVICTPHQLGAFHFNRGDDIRYRVGCLQAELDQAEIPLRVLAGADVRIEDGMVDRLRSGDVLTLADHGRHVLLELPHELYFPLEGLLDSLAAASMVGVLSHPERNGGLLSRPELIDSLVDRGCLMQVTAGSLTGAFGLASRELARQMAQRGAIHFLSTDAHGATRRRPRLGDALREAESLVGEQAAHAWCVEFPMAVAQGRDVPAGHYAVRPPRRGWSLFKRSAA